MAFLIDLWLPILVSAVAVWVASALAWTALGHHKKDMQELTPQAEEELKQVLSRHGVTPGVYGYPNFNSFKGKSKEEVAAMMTRPMGILRVWRGMGMAGPMVFGFVWSLIIGVLIAYIGHPVLPKGTEFAKVMQVLGTAGVLAYAFGGVVNDVWFQESKRAMVLCFIDGVVYGLITGAIFAWLWPK